MRRERPVCDIPPPNLNQAADRAGAKSHEVHLTLGSMRWCEGFRAKGAILRLMRPDAGIGACWIADSFVPHVRVTDTIITNPERAAHPG